MDDRSLFERAMRDVEPLEGRSERVLKRRPRRRGAKPRPARAVRFRVARFGPHIEGLAEGAGEGVLQRLRAGRVEVERKVDLHGLDAENARQMLRDLLATAWKTGQRCLLVVHGRGANSPGGPVLKEGLPGWLAEAPHGRRVLAFTTASRQGGGGGAMLILLRRKPTAGSSRSSRPE